MAGRRWRKCSARRPSTRPARTRSRTMSVVNLRDLLQEMIEKGASDLHLTAGLPPMIRVDGEVLPSDRPALTPEQTQALTYSALNEDHQKRFEATKELDFSFDVRRMSCLRGNA